ncbi:MAG: hypothetical protein M3069_24005 [Chloroflexota bacterium]|nr:hypothetical protein [Chloroflexota bacterium]
MAAPPATAADRSPRRTEAQTGAWGRRAALAVCVLVALLVKAPQFVTPMGQDQGLYHTVGEEILRGGVPYRDAWDPKPPGIFYIHAAVLSLINDPWRACQLGGVPGLSRSNLQPRCGALLFATTDFVYSLVVAGLVLLVARHLGFAPPAAVVAFGFTAIFANLALLDAEGSTPEKYALGPAVGVVLAGLKAIRTRQHRWLILAGGLAAIAALLKLPDLASFGALSLVLVWLRRGRELVWMWVPLLGILALVAVVFVAMGAGGPFVEATLVYNFARAGFQSDHIVYAALASAWQLFRGGLALLWLPAVFGAAAAWRVPRWRLVLMWAALDVTALFLGGTKFTREYFMQLVPSFSLLAALGLEALWMERAGDKLTRGWLLVSLGVIGVLSGSFQASFSMRAWNEYIASGWTTTSVERLASMIAELPAGETLFVWGDESELYALSGRLPSTRFLNSAGVAANADSSVKTRRAELMASLTHAPPGIIVVDRRTATDDPDGRLQLNVQYFSELQQLLSDSYREMDGAVLRPYLGGDREQVFVRTAPADLCAAMSGCRLRDAGAY